MNEQSKKLRKRFFFHFNRPASLKAGTPKMSVHFDKQCLIVDKVTCNVPTESKINNRQPRVVMRGKANNFTLWHHVDGTEEMVIEDINFL